MIGILGEVAGDDEVAFFPNIELVVAGTANVAADLQASRWLSLRGLIVVLTQDTGRRPSSNALFDDTAAAAMVLRSCGLVVLNHALRLGSADLQVLIVICQFFVFLMTKRTANLDLLLFGRFFAYLLANLVRLLR